MVNLPVYDLEGKEITTVSASDDIFASTKSKGVAQQALVWYMAGQRAGTASTKTRSEVRGGGTKPWNQKGTGRARAGTIRSPLWNGGGVIFGPKPRDYSFKLPKKARGAALKVVLSDRVKEKALKVIEAFSLSSGKTKEAAKILKPFLGGAPLLLIVSKLDESLRRAIANLEKVKLAAVEELNVYHLLSAGNILITQGALKKLEERIKKQ